LRNSLIHTENNRKPEAAHSHPHEQMALNFTRVRLHGSWGDTTSVLGL
jgi:hypothetical protein